MQLQLTSAFSSAAGGIAAAESRLDQDAQEIARDPFDVDALVDAEFAPVAVQANAAVFRAADDTSRSIIDVYA
ncbi:MAG: flagellar hook protein FlgE [Gaiellales bacterium]